MLTRLATSRPAAVKTIATCLVTAGLVWAGTTAVTDTGTVVPDLIAQALDEGPPAERLPGHDIETTQWFPQFNNTNACRYVEPSDWMLDEFGEPIDHNRFVTGGDDPWRSDAFAGAACKIVYDGIRDGEESVLGHDDVDNVYLHVEIISHTPIPDIRYHGYYFEDRRAAAINACDAEPTCQYQPQPWTPESPCCHDAYSLAYWATPHDGEHGIAVQQYNAWVSNAYITVTLTKKTGNDRLPDTEFQTATTSIASDVLALLADSEPVE